MTPLDEAISVCGSAAALADALGISRSAPAMWKARANVPAEWCPSIERITKKLGHVVECERLNPKVEWYVIRGKRRPSKQEA